MSCKAFDGIFLRQNLSREYHRDSQGGACQLNLNLVTTTKSRFVTCIGTTEVELHIQRSSHSTFLSARSCMSCHWISSFSIFNKWLNHIPWSSTIFLMFRFVFMFSIFLKALPYAEALASNKPSTLNKYL